MTRQNRTISPRVRRECLERDNNRCLKCGKQKPLELHHIVPAYLGGIEESWNLISLCHRCHEFAPDEPTEFFKWASTSLPPKLDESLKLTKICIGLLSFKKELVQELVQISNFDIKVFESTGKGLENSKTFNWIDNFYKDMWKVHVSNEMAQLGIFIEEYFPKSIPKEVTP